MKHRALILACLLSVGSASAWAADIASSVKERLLRPEVLRGEFEQSKQVNGFKKPLLSRGDFLVVNERGVVWRTREPFASVLKLTRDEIVATQGNDVAFKLNASKEPSVRVINGLLFSLLNGDVSKLGEHFKIEGEANAKTWKLVLTSRQAALAKLMSKVELTGDQYVRRIDIDETNGDKTSIRFSAQNSEPAKLSREEATRFD